MAISDIKCTCIIFDLDGTLVNSEEINARAMVEILDHLPLDAQEIIHQYKGWKLAAIVEDLSKIYDVSIPVDFETTYRDRVDQLFSTELKAFDGVEAALSCIPHQKCIASSAPLQKIKHALKVTSLGHYFNSNLFSSYEIRSWKPEPQLFLTAAARMGADPKYSIVIEDSCVGLKAAHSAKMKAIIYQPDGTILNADDLAFEHYSQLPALIESIRELHQSG